MHKLGLGFVPELKFLRPNLISAKHLITYCSRGLNIMHNTLVPDMQGLTQVVLYGTGHFSIVLRACACSQLRILHNCREHARAVYHRLSNSVGCQQSSTSAILVMLQHHAMALACKGVCKGSVCPPKDAHAHALWVNVGVQEEYRLHGS